MSWMPYPVIATKDPCAVCGKPILPGSLYKPSPDGPTHFGCR